MGEGNVKASRDKRRQYDVYEIQSDYSHCQAPKFVV